MESKGSGRNEGGSNNVQRSHALLFPSSSNRWLNCTPRKEWADPLVLIEQWDCPAKTYIENRTLGGANIVDIYRISFLNDQKNLNI